MEQPSESPKSGAALLEELAQKPIIPARPKNETDHRFVLSKEQFSRDRILAVKEQVKEMKDKYPEFLSMNLFGSMIKGTAHEKSDIDGVVFVDTDIIAKRIGLNEDELIKYNERGHLVLSQDIAKEYTLAMRNGLKEKTGLSDEFVSDIRTSPISEAVIDMDINKSLKYYRAKDAYDSDYDNWVKSRPKRGCSIDDLINHEKSQPKRPEYTKTDLGQMFNLDVGGGIKKYRSMLIEKLNNLGADGERIWSDLVETAELYENGLGSTQRYPRTLEDARKLYSLKSEEK